MYSGKIAVPPGGGGIVRNLIAVTHISVNIYVFKEF
jgi:hypothetical protein